MTDIVTIDRGFTDMRKRRWEACGGTGHEEVSSLYLADQIIWADALSRGYLDMGVSARAPRLQVDFAAIGEVDSPVQRAGKCGKLCLDELDHGQRHQIGIHPAPGVIEHRHGVFSFDASQAGCCCRGGR